MLNKKTLKDQDFKGKKALVRVDFNVPMGGKDKKEIADDGRIVAAIPTIKKLQEDGAAVILMSHLGRPKGEPNKDFTLKPVADRLSQLLGEEVLFLASDKVVDDKVREEVSKLKPGQVALLENTRFRPEEEANGQEFAKELASLGDIYVNDAFGTCHRGHASNLGVSRLLPSAVGKLVEKELDIMGGALENPARPFLAIMGGAKVSDKIGVIENLLEVVDSIIVGGGMAYTFLKAQGYEIGKSLLEEDKMELSLELIKKAEEKGVKILLPVDGVAADDFSEDANTKVMAMGEIEPSWEYLDIGPKTREIFVNEIKKAKTMVWNGPMGVFEMEPFSAGTFAIAQALADSDGVTIVGGGDSALAIEKCGLKDKITHVSTGGGASLQFLEGVPLEGLEGMEEK